MAEVVLESGLSKKPEEKKSWLENKKLAYIILAVGMSAIFIIFFFLFSSLMNQPVQ